MAAAGEERGPDIAWLFFGWSGRLSRAPFALGWAFWLMLLSAAFTRIMIVPKEDPSFLLWAFVFIGTGLVSTVSCLMLSIKRLHDMNLPTLLVACLFFPVVSILALLALLFWPGTDGPNDHGRLADRATD